MTRIPLHPNEWFGQGPLSKSARKENRAYYAALDVYNKACAVAEKCKPYSRKQLAAIERARAVWDIMVHIRVTVNEASPRDWQRPPRLGPTPKLE